MRASVTHTRRMIHAPWRGEPWDLALAIVFLLGCLAVPLTFSVGSVDAFALPKTAAVRILMVLALGIVGLRLGVGGQISIPSIGALDWAMLGFVVTNSAAFAFSMGWRQSFYGEGLQHQGVLALALYVAFFYLARAVFRDPDRTRQLAAALVGGAFVVSVYAVLQRLGLDPAWDLPSSTRVFSTIGQPNALAAYLVLSIPIAVALSHSPSIRLKVFSITTLVVSLTALAFTLSRGGYIGLVVSGAVLVSKFGRHDGHAKKQRHRGVLVGIGLLAVVALTLGNTLWSAVGDTDLGRRSDHLSLWKVGLAITADHPLVGTGQETYSLVFPEYRDDVLDLSTARYLSTFRPESPHNVYIAIAAGAGVPTLAALLAVVALALRRILAGAMKASRTTRALLIGIAAAMTGHLVTDFFMTQEVTGSWVLWVLMGSGVATATGIAEVHPD